MGHGLRHGGNLVLTEPAPHRVRLHLVVTRTAAPCASLSLPLYGCASGAVIMGASRSLGGDASTRTRNAPFGPINLGTRSNSALYVALHEVMTLRELVGHGQTI